MRKKLKNAAVLVLSFALTGMVLTGCGEGKEEIRQEPDVEISQDYEDNFAVDSEAAKEFAVKVKEITAKKDLEALA